MSTHPVVDQVNRIVGNLLFSEHAVYLPEVGTLSVERRPAQKLSRQRIVPPCYEVEFSSAEAGRSLVAAIAEAAQCDSTKAQAIYGRWIARVRREQTLTIEGVGTLRQKSFIPDPVFVKQLNPRGCEEITVRPESSNTWLWSLACVAVACGIAACGWILYDHIHTIFPVERSQTVAAHSVVERAETPTPSTTNAESTADISGDESSAAAATPTKTIDSPSAATSVASAATATKEVGASAASAVRPQGFSAESLVSGRSYVVLGVFSTEQNAQRAVREAQAADTDAALRCGVYYYGPKFMAALFSSDDATACRAFASTRADRYPDAWCYKAK